MAKSKKQRRIEAQDRKDARKIFTVIAISTAIFLVLLYFMYSNA